MSQLTDEEITPYIARTVLGFMGDLENGVQPGGFCNALLSASGRADREHFNAIGKGFPGLMAAMDMAKLHHGLIDLRRIAAQ